MSYGIKSSKWEITEDGETYDMEFISCSQTLTPVSSSDDLMVNEGYLLNENNIVTDCESSGLCSG